MSRTTLTTVALIALVWTAMLSFGGVAAETVMLYPNVFGDPPASLDGPASSSSPVAPATTSRRWAPRSWSAAWPRRS
jgi:hypothetical protein